MLKPLLAATSLVAMVLPFSAGAEPWGGGDYNHQWSYGYYNTFSGYPQFRGEKAHIRGEIRQGINEGWLDHDQANDFYRQLQWVQYRESREFGEHGWSLPWWDQRQIKFSLDNIDQSVDQARDSSDNEGYPLQSWTNQQ